MHLAYGVTISISHCRKHCRLYLSAPLTLPAIEQDTVRHRVDLQIARIELDTLAKTYGLTQATRFINVLDAGYADKITKDKETGDNIRDRGFTVSFEIPIFDFGETRVREAEQTYMQAVNRLSAKSRQRAIGGTRRLSQLSLELRYRQALSARRTAAAQDHLRRD